MSKLAFRRFDGGLKEAAEKINELDMSGLLVSLHPQELPVIGPHGEISTTMVVDCLFLVGDGFTWEYWDKHKTEGSTKVF